jgi:hypothetical protein
MNRRAAFGAFATVGALLLPRGARAQLVSPGYQTLAARDGLRNPPPFLFDFTGGALPAGATFARASVGWAFGPTGTFTAYGNNVPRWSYDSAGALRGLWNEAAATNVVRNDSGVGAVAPSTPPTNWSIPNPVITGLNCTVVGPFTESGVAGVDLRYQGTRGANSIHTIDLEPLPGSPAAPGDIWGGVGFAKLLNVVTGGLNAFRLSAQPLNASQGGLTAVTLAAINAPPVGGLIQDGQFAGAAALNDPLTASARPRLTVTILAGDIDLTLRVGLPTIYKTANNGGGQRNSAIPTTTAAVTRAADVLRVPLADGVYTFTVYGTNTSNVGPPVIGTFPGVVASGGFAIVPNFDYPLRLVSATRTA